MEVRKVSSGLKCRYCKKSYIELFRVELRKGEDNCCPRCLAKNAAEIEVVKFLQIYDSLNMDEKEKLK